MPPQDCDFDGCTDPAIVRSVTGDNQSSLQGPLCDRHWVIVHGDSAALAIWLKKLRERSSPAGSAG